MDAVFLPNIMLACAGFAHDHVTYVMRNAYIFLCHIFHMCAKFKQMSSMLFCIKHDFLCRILCGSQTILFIQRCRYDYRLKQKHDSFRLVKIKRHGKVKSSKHCEMNQRMTFSQKKIFINVDILTPSLTAFDVQTIKTG